MTEPIVMENVWFSYGEKEVLRGFDLTLKPGERMALTGPSGMGKTTVLFLLAGLLRPDKGEIRGLPPQGVSMVFQEDRLIGGLTVEENVRLVNPALPPEELEGLMEELGLAGEGRSLPDSLSGGMKRRAAILRALACRRPLYLLDEPFKGLDGETLRRTAAAVSRQVGSASLVLVTHDLREADLLDAREFSLARGACPNRVWERA